MAQTRNVIQFRPNPISKEAALAWVKALPSGYRLTAADLSRKWCLHRNKVQLWLKEWRDAGEIEQRKHLKIGGKITKKKILVYFIGTNTRVKIGRTNNLEARLAMLQTSNYEHLSVLGTIENPSPKLEQRLHAKFAKYRIRGEWFEFSIELRAFIISSRLPPE